MSEVDGHRRGAASHGCGSLSRAQAVAAAAASSERLAHAPQPPRRLPLPRAQRLTRRDLAARHHSPSCVLPCSASSSAKHSAQPSPPSPDRHQTGACMERACMHSPQLRRSREAAAPLLRRRRAVPAPHEFACCLRKTREPCGLACVCVESSTSHKEPACPQSGTDLATATERRAAPCGRLTGDKSMAKTDRV